MVIALKVQFSLIGQKSCFSDKKLQNLKMEYKSDVEAKKNFFPTLRSTTLAILVFVGVSVVGVGFLLVSDRVNRRLSTMESALEGLNRKVNQIPNISDASSVELSARQKRSTSSNGTPTQSDFEKRLQALEKR